MYTAKEVENKMSYTYLGSLYYDSELSGLLSVDMMVDTKSWVSPCSYCQNYSIGRIDSTGALDGDFYDQKGKYLETDGNDDGKVYVITNKDEAKAIKKTDKSGGTTNLSSISSAVISPSKSVRSEMVKVVGEDKKESLREYGGIFRTNASGNDKLIWGAITGSNNTAFEWRDIMYNNEGNSRWRSYRGIIDPVDAARQINTVNGVHKTPWNDFGTK